MIFLSLNPGSTSTKFSLYDGEMELLKSEFEGEVTNIEEKLAVKNFRLKQIDAFGIRVVHGGTKFSEPTKITEDVLNEIKKCAKFAPLHNPPAIRIIEQLLHVDPNATLFAVFDTAFHRTIEEPLRRYAVTKEMADELEIQKFGFHGIACQSVVTQLKAQNALPEKLVIAHLGGGASVTAVKNGNSVDTSMGFTPLEGLMMVTRSGSIDPGIITFLQEEKNMSPQEVLDLLNTKSGILGIAKTTDVKTVFEAKTPEHRLARDMFLARVVKHIFAAAGILGGLDTLVLSGGIGRKNEWLQNELTKAVAPLGCHTVEIIEVDEAKEICRQGTEKV